MTTTCFIGLGSNLDNPQAQVESAIKHLQRLPKSQWIKHSPWYQSKAVGPGEQDDYINGVAQIDTNLPAQVLLRHLQSIEQHHGRTRSIRWGSRTLDLDILLYGQETIATPTLSIPHPYLTQRSFVIMPLADLAPDLILPDGTALSSLLSHCDRQDIMRLQ